jgi:hypothetical protein
MARPRPDKPVAIALLATLTTLASVAGCDFWTDATPGGGVDAGAAETARTSGVDAAAAAEMVPAACRVASERKPPIGVTFRFQNQGGSPVFLRAFCVPEISIASCASGYTDDIGPKSFNACLCEFNGCPVGGPCNDMPLAIAPGASSDLAWDGSFIVTVRKGARECHERKLAVAARYRLAFKVYGSVDDARMGQSPLTTVQTDFELGTSDVVAVPIRP